MHTGDRIFPFALILAIGVALASCAADGSLSAPATQATPYPPPGFSHTIQTSAVVLYWNCGQPESNVVEVNGVAFNPWQSQPVRDLEVELVGVDVRDRTVSETSAVAPDTQIHTNQSTPFQLRLRTSGSESRLDLYYRYKFQEGGRDFIVAGPGWNGPVLLAQQMQFRVRDACSESQHRVR
jgi:hypothetical protein